MTSRIVLIEDDPDTATLVEEMLREIGHRVDTRARLEDGPGDDEAELVITDLVPLRTFELSIAREWIARVRDRVHGRRLRRIARRRRGQRRRRNPT